MIGHGVCLVASGVCIIAHLISYEIEQHSSTCQNEQTLITASGSGSLVRKFSVRRRSVEGTTPEEYQKDEVMSLRADLWNLPWRWQRLARSMAVNRSFVLTIRLVTSPSKGGKPSIDSLKTRPSMGLPR